MKSGSFDFWTWMTGCSGWSFYCAVLSTFGVTGYYSSLLKDSAPAWLMVALFSLPIAIVLIMDRSIAPDRVVAVSHLVAASWFMILALGMEVGHLLGYRPKESGLFQIMAHLGWTFAWAGIYRRARQARQKALEEGGTSGNRLPSP